MLFYGFKITFKVLNLQSTDTTRLKLFLLPNVILIPTEVLHFEWQ
jgi:hypothetical protein